MECCKNCYVAVFAAGITKESQRNHKGITKASQSKRLAMLALKFKKIKALTRVPDGIVILNLTRMEKSRLKKIPPKLKYETDSDSADSALADTDKQRKARRPTISQSTAISER